MWFKLFSSGGDTCEEADPACATITSKAVCDEAVAELGPGMTEGEIANARRIAENGILQQTETLNISVKVRARRTGNNVGNIGEIEAREFELPVDVCFGCLLSCATCEEPGICPAGSVPVDDKDRLFMGDFVGVHLAGAIDRAEIEVSEAVSRRDYGAAMAGLAKLRAPVDAFFDKVLVNAEDEAVRRNRLALLASLQSLFLEVADIAQLQQ